MQGGGAYIEGSANFINCALYGNEGSQAGGAYIGSSTPASFINCALHNNEAVNGRGGGVVVYGSANFIGCNLYDNKAIWVRARILNLLDPSSSAPVNVTRLIAYFCMQGGGAFIEGSATFTGCNLYNNTANGVRARILNFLEPSSIAPLNSDPLRCFDTQEVGTCT